MLSIYLYEKQLSNWVKDNDWFFDKKTVSLVKEKQLFPIVRDCIHAIDDCSLDETATKISGKFGSDLPLSTLSTGCKTALNVMLNDDIIFFGGECGSNALDVIYNWIDGNIFIKAFPSTVFAPDTEFICHTDEHTSNIWTLKELEGWWTSNGYR